MAGWIDTPSHDVERKARMFAGGDPAVALGLGFLLPATVDEVLAALAHLAGGEMDRGRGRSWVSPDAVVGQVERAAERLASACRGGQRVFFGTGHPTGPLEMYARLAQAIAARGARIVRVAEGVSFEGYAGGAQVRYVCDVACVAMGGDLVHTHSARAMEFLLGGGMRADLVVGDHGFAGAALAAGIDTVAVVDTNDPALLLAWRRGLPVWPILCDDNRPPAAYASLVEFVVERL